MISSTDALIILRWMSKHMDEIWDGDYTEWCEDDLWEMEQERWQDYERLVMEREELWLL